MADLWRLTGSPEGRTRAGRFQTVLTRVQFFEDSHDLTTIRWYGVPETRPVVPYPSFVANEAWYNINGPRSGMLYGQFQNQGVQADPPPRYVVQDTTPGFNPVHICGNAAQWSGDLSIDRPADLGSADCCKVGVYLASGGLSVGGIDADSLRIGLTEVQDEVPGIEQAGVEGGEGGVSGNDGATWSTFAPPVCTGEDPGDNLHITFAGGGAPFDGTYAMHRAAPGFNWTQVGLVQWNSINVGFSFNCGLVSAGVWGMALGDFITPPDPYSPGGGTNSPLNITFTGIDFSRWGGPTGGTAVVTL